MIKRIDIIIAFLVVIAVASLSYLFFVHEPQLKINHEENKEYCYWLMKDLDADSFEAFSNSKDCMICINNEKHDCYEIGERIYCEAEDLKEICMTYQSR